MIKVKGNYKNGYRDLNCRACGKAPETQTHVLNECEKLNPEGTTSMNDNDTETSGHETNKTGRDTDSDNRIGNTLNDQNTTNEDPIVTNETLRNNRQSDNPNGDETSQNVRSRDSDNLNPDKGQLDIFNEDPIILGNLSKIIDLKINELMLDEN